MKNRILLPFILLLTIALIAPGCKKDSPLSTSTLTLDKERYASLELAQWIATDLTFSQGTYDATIDNSVTVTLVATDSVLLFAVPPLANGQHAITITIEGQFFHSYFTVSNAPAGNLANYFTGILSEYIVQKNYLTAHANALSSAEQSQLSSDMQVIQSYIDSASAQLTGMSDTEKQHAADIIQGYRGWMNDLGVAVGRITVAVNALQSAPQNDDQKAIAALQGAIDAKNFISSNAGKIIRLTSTENLVNTFYAGKGTGAGTRAGARIVLALLLNELEMLNVATRELVAIPLVPFENLLVNGGAAVDLTNGSLQQVFVTLDYRTPYNADQSSSVVLLSAFANAIIDLNAQWNDVVSRFSAPLQFGPLNIDSITTYNTENRQPHSNFLSITDISNSTVTLDSIDRTGGALRLLFSSTDTSDISFTFNVTYNSDLGTMSSAANAVLRD